VIVFLDSSDLAAQLCNQNRNKDDFMTFVRFSDWGFDQETILNEG